MHTTHLFSCTVAALISGLPVSAPVDVTQLAVVGATVVEGAMLVVAAALVAAHVQRAEGQSRCTSLISAFVSLPH